ncbi:MAG: hypothetical protein PHE49_04505 [bacterium]|nr:hypothetical protein [bacterium]
MNVSVLKERYLNDPLPIKLGGIAADLARIQSFSDNIKHLNVVKSIVKECRCMIEWAAFSTEPEASETLINIQLELSLWLLSWEEMWNVSEKRTIMAKEAGKMSDKVLEMSGILTKSVE